MRIFRLCDSHRGLIPTTSGKIRNARIEAPSGLQNYVYIRSRQLHKLKSHQNETILRYKQGSYFQQAPESSPSYQAHHLTALRSPPFRSPRNKPICSRPQDDEVSKNQNYRVNIQAHTQSLFTPISCSYSISDFTFLLSSLIN